MKGEEEEEVEEGRERGEPVIREIKRYVYSVMAHVLWI